MEQDRKKRSVSVRVYLPKELYALMKEKAGGSKLDLSRLLRRAIERDIKKPRSFSGRAGMQTNDRQ